MFFDLGYRRCHGLGRVRGSGWLYLNQKGAGGAKIRAGAEARIDSRFPGR